MSRTGDQVTATREASASTSATTRAAEKLLTYGISTNAVTSTPATDPIVLTKNTLPAPASPAR